MAKAGAAVEPLQELRLKTLSRMTTASRYPDGEDAPVDLFDAADGEEALRSCHPASRCSVIAAAR